MTDTECISGYLRCVDMSTIHIADDLAFRRMLVELSQNITEDELGAIKFMCAGKVPKRCQEKAMLPFELWDALVERNEIAPGNTEFLKYILRHSVGGRTDLLEIVVRYESDGITASQVNGIHCQESLPDMGYEFELISTEIGRDWRRMVRKLGVSDSDIDTVAEHYPRDVREQIRHLLVLWQKRIGPEASRKDIVDALRKCQRNTLATKLERM